ncbi:MAG: deoxyribose-phosphate aldolase [Prevotellaceae bacterium]|jgi:deoxyribose-phosphate aldolase|nr:deoxyribose-phosphate aldolase [Prevotellaceae bacterium]
MEQLFDTYNMEVSAAEVAQLLADITAEAKLLQTAEVYRQCLSFVDYTTLNSTDTLERGREFAERVNQFPAKYAGVKNVAAICVYPALVNAVRKTLDKNNGVKIAAVGAGFPASQTYIDVKIAECIMAVEHGADEIDIVLSLGRFLDEDYQTTFDEVAQIKDAIGDAHLKVILETGALKDLSKIRIASLMSMEAGADFIKTSTGKMEPAATPEAAIVMCTAIKDFYEKTGRKVGFKPAGGISTSAEAALYYGIVKHILGSEWLNSDLFRIGTSRLANYLLSDITGKEEKYF